MLNIGDNIDKYRLIDRIGEGGMGEVWVAENTMLGKNVALKLLRQELAHEEEAVRRFIQEARMAAAVEHPGVVEIFDFGWVLEKSPYIVMELLKGESLDMLLERQRPLSIKRVTKLMVDILSVLEAVHDKGIVHRDLKPENIFLSRGSEGREQVKILDFGISKMKSGNTALRLTQTGVVLGTPYYMSPEQARGEREIDRRVDIWSMGAVSYEMITGNLPYPGDSYNQVLARILIGKVQPIREQRADVPAWIETVIGKAMAWDTDERYQDAREFIHDLEDSLDEVMSPSRGSAVALFRPESGLEEKIVGFANDDRRGDDDGNHDTIRDARADRSTPLEDAVKELTTTSPDKSEALTSTDEIPTGKYGEEGVSGPRPIAAWAKLLAIGALALVVTGVAVLLIRAFWETHVEEDRSASIGAGAVIEPRADGSTETEARDGGLSHAAGDELTTSSANATAPTGEGWDAALDMEPEQADTLLARAAMGLRRCLGAEDDARLRILADRSGSLSLEGADRTLRPGERSCIQRQLEEIRLEPTEVDRRLELPLRAHRVRTTPHRARPDGGPARTHAEPARTPTELAPVAPNVDGGPRRPTKTNPFAGM